MSETFLVQKVPVNSAVTFYNKVKAVNKFSYKNHLENQTVNLKKKFN